jgi:hypothetical protein
LKAIYEYSDLAVGDSSLIEVNKYIKELILLIEEKTRIHAHT